MTSLDGLLEATVVGSFARTGFTLRSRYFGPLPRLDGRAAVVTGGSSGIGLAAATALAELGARVVIVGRDGGRLSTASARVTAATGGEVVGRVADLSLLGDARRLAADLARAEPGLHILVNNVSVLSPERRITAEGIELTLATNLLAPFLLTNLIVPILVPGARIVTVSSGGMYTQPLDVAALDPAGDDYRGATAYARTKRAQVVLSELWAERFAPVGVVAHSMHPGWVDTPGLAASLPGFRTMLRPLLRSPAQGADTIAFLAAGEEPGRSTGRFWHDRRPRPTHRLRRTRSGDVERAALWSYLADRSGWLEPPGWPGGR